MNLGFLGLGQMGRPMARNLLRAGHSVTVWNRTRSKADELAASDRARVARSPAEAAQDAQVVLSSLANDEAVIEAVLGNGSAGEPVLAGLRPGAAHLSLSTISPALSKRLARAHADAGQRYAAAPVLGRPDAAEHGELVVLVAGPEALVEESQPLFDALGKETHYLGLEPERANLTKVAANLVMASMLEVFGEAYALAESYGVGALQLLGILEDSMLRPEALDAYGRRIASQQFEPAGFRLELGLKDVDLALAAGEAAALQMPFASVLRDRFLVAMARGLAGQDWSAVARTLPHKRAA
jgi:3-hydroxyisobutyrate dehydrogenase-like beta-hydroxyacid dehydrogenase